MSNHVVEQEDPAKIIAIIIIILKVFKMIPVCYSFKQVKMITDVSNDFFIDNLHKLAQSTYQSNHSPTNYKSLNKCK